MTTWRSLRDNDGNIVEGSGTSDCGSYTLNKIPYAGEVWFSAYFGHGPKAIFLARSLDRDEVERAVDEHKRHHAERHENGDGV